MSSYADINKARYLPESFPEAFLEGTVTTTGTVVANYSRFDPNFLNIQNVAFDDNTDVEFYMNTDDRGEVLRIAGPVALAFEAGHVPISVNMIRNGSLILRPVAANRTNEAMRYNVTIRKKTAIDGYRLKSVPSGMGELITSAGLPDQVDAGLVGSRVDLLGDEILKSFQDSSPYGGVFIVSQRIPAVTAGDEEGVIVAKPITVPDGHVAVLLGVAVDGQTTRNLATYNDTFIYVDRHDGNQRGLVRMDFAAMPGVVAGTIGNFMRMYIPTLKRIDLRVTSASGLIADAQMISYMFGIRPITALDRINWAPYAGSDYDRVNDRVTALDNAYQLSAKAAIGVM